jgi:hypothetical protein
MKKVFAIAAGLLWLTLTAAAPGFAQSTGSKIFGCIEMQWQIPPGQSAVHLQFLKKGESFGRLHLSPEDNFRQFSFSAESVFIEGRLRVKYDQEAHKGLLRFDSLTYRCYSPADRSFSGEIAEFDLPETGN